MFPANFKNEYFCCTSLLDLCFSGVYIRIHSNLFNDNNTHFILIDELVWVWIFLSTRLWSGDQHFTICRAVICAFSWSFMKSILLSFSNINNHSVKNYNTCNAKLMSLNSRNSDMKATFLYIENVDRDTNQIIDFRLVYVYAIDKYFKVIVPNRRY